MRRGCPVLALSGHPHDTERCLLLEVKRKSRKAPAMSASDPNRILAIPISSVEACLHFFSAERLMDGDSYG